MLKIWVGIESFISVFFCQKWKESLKKYDQNKDGKLSGNELLLAYPEIQTLMENDVSYQ